MKMVNIKNLSLQGLEIYFNTPDGWETFYFKPKQIVTVPENYISPQIRNLSKRRLIRLFG